MRKPLRFKRKKKRVSFLRQRFFWYGIGLVFLLVFLFWVVLFSPWLNIQEIKVEGESEILKERILFVIEESFWQSFLGIPQNSILLVREAELREDLLSSFPLILGVTLKRSLPKTLVIEITQRQQVAAWCPPVGETDKNSSCFALDRQGIPFKEAANTDEYVVFYSKGNPVLGQELLHPSLLATLLSFKETFAALGEPMQFKTAAFEIGQGGQVEGVTSEGWRVLLKIEENMEWQITKLKLVLEQQIPQERRGDLEYIDLRFGDQAYLKYKD